ncbi:MAG: hypothetical protein QOI39_2901 [Mycobacterium sp.]|jgi:hypothetical protein|nr:hypothetical protein [Mycobacterium sp.]
MADTGTAAALAANFDFIKEGLDTIPDYVVDADSIEVRGIQGVHWVKSMPETLTPVRAAGLSASV